jgi:hypothetical protein
MYMVRYTHDQSRKKTTQGMRMCKNKYKAILKQQNNL